MTNDLMIRGALPLLWFALIGSTALLYGLPVNDPAWGDLIATLRQWHAPLPAFILLALLTLLLGFPSKRELIISTAVGAAASVILAVLAAFAGLGHIGWFLIAVFVLVVPLSGFLLRRLMLRGVVDHN